MKPRKLLLKALWSLYLEYEDSSLSKTLYPDSEVMTWTLKSWSVAAGMYSSSSGEIVI